ncbi:MAG: hypothetical protein DME07_10595 [Candidatus Rokuibacteriota bacterium]|nr:MAG: hypothetical protein DME07_10595 [Candidatus Rokubacteria bacterium]PYN57163.1 MAG: hypothetical protein DMD94_05160 [Candidatus Rokubacteria bacterium]
MALGQDPAEPTMDPAALYREDTYTDRRIGTIRVLTPVKPDGTVDLGRKVLYAGEAQILTQTGVLPLGFDIEASSLSDAVEKFAAGAKAAIERTVRELQELRREAASSLVIPARMPPDPRVGPGGMRGGGLIELP